MIEYGRMLMIQQVITNASREGARVAVLEGSTKTDVEATINAYLDASSIDGATITVAPTLLSDADAGDPVTVTVSINFNQVSWLPSPMYLGGTELSASTVMRREAAG
jgi:Flp pilus assembly protein TadG